MRYSREACERAENPFVMAGMTCVRLARLSGVPAREIANASMEDDWRGKGQEFRCAVGEIKRNVVLLRSRLLDEAADEIRRKILGVKEPFPKPGVKQQEERVEKVKKSIQNRKIKRKDSEENRK
jgi:hypothetical protein